MPRSSLPLSQRDPRSIVTLEEVVRHTTLSRDTLSRRFRRKFRRLSANRVGMTVADALAIAEGSDS
jgi:hypothetical protein